MHTVFTIVDYAICSRCGYSCLRANIVSNILTIIYSFLKTRNTDRIITYLLTLPSLGSNESGATV